MPAVHTLALNHVNFDLAPARRSRDGTVRFRQVDAAARARRHHPPDVGTVTFQGANLTAMSDADRTKLRRGAFGFVFQSGQLLPELPAVENIALPMMLDGADYRSATDAAMLWLERLGLRQLASQRPGEMSGGRCSASPSPAHLPYSRRSSSPTSDRRARPVHRPRGHEHSHGCRA